MALSGWRLLLLLLLLGSVGSLPAARLPGSDRQGGWTRAPTGKERATAGLCFCPPPPRKTPASFPHFKSSQSCLYPPPCFPGFFGWGGEGEKGPLTFSTRASFTTLRVPPNQVEEQFERSL